MKQVAVSERPYAPSAGELASRAAARTAARLDQLERLLRTQEAELNRKDKEIRKLQEANRVVKRENREMHHFLADYGLQWVGPSQPASAAYTWPGSVRSAIR